MHILNLFLPNVFVTDSASLRVNIVAPKTVNLIGKGFFQLMDDIFWDLSFPTINQANAVRQRANTPMSEEEWTESFKTITDEHSSWLVPSGTGLLCRGPSQARHRPAGPGRLKAWTASLSNSP